MATTIRKHSQDGMTYEVMTIRYEGDHRKYNTDTIILSLIEVDGRKVDKAIAIPMVIKDE